MMKRVVVYIMLLMAVAIVAQTPRIKSLEEQRKSAQAEIEETKQLLDENKRTTSNALNRLSLLTRQIVTRREVIRLLNDEINEADKAIYSAESNIKVLERELKSKKDIYAESVRKMYISQNEQNKLLFIFSADNFAQSYRRVLYLREFSKWERRQAEDVVKKQNQLNVEKEKLIHSKAEKLDLLQGKKLEEEKLVGEETVQKTEVQTLRKEQKQLNAELGRKKKQAQALDRAIEKAIADEIARSEREAKAAAGAKALAEKNKAKDSKAPVKTPEQTAETRITETKGGFSMTKEERVLSDNFFSNKGKLPYPLKGNYKVVSGFGQHQDPGLKHVTRNNNGIDIQTTSGNKACSVFKGEVSAVFAVPGNDKSNNIIVRHGNYLTVYCNLTDLIVKRGDMVSTGQALGTIYTNPEDGAILHFEIREEKQKLNPLNWLN
ncbi:peptidase [Bacteroidia bacterium]|nr:peptidase [Bacteroidia bacterium]